MGWRIGMKMLHDGCSTSQTPIRLGKNADSRGSVGYLIGVSPKLQENEPEIPWPTAGLLPKLEAVGPGVQ